MIDKSNREITVVGAGFMGTVIAPIYARHGYHVRITDLVPKALETFHERAKPIVASLVNERMDADAILANVKLEPALDTAVKGSFFVQEVIHENLEAKQELFAKLDQMCPPEVVLATNTSSFRLSDVCKDVRHRERVLGVHYITPAHIIDVVELIRADFTPDSLIEWAHGFLKTIDHIGVVCTEEPGFLVNRLQYALLSEAYRIVELGIASREDVDKAMRQSLGPRLALWGPAAYRGSGGQQEDLGSNLGLSVRQDGRREIPQASCGHEVRGSRSARRHNRQGLVQLRGRLRVNRPGS